MTSHPPDEYTQQARELWERALAASDGAGPWSVPPAPIGLIAAALRARDASAYRRGAEEMRERAKGVCERMVVGGRAWTAEQALAAEVLFAARDEIAALALPTGPAAPEGEHAKEQREHEERCAAARARPDVVPMLSGEEPLDTEPHAVGDIWRGPSGESRTVTHVGNGLITLEEPKHTGIGAVKFWMRRGWRRVRRGGGA